MKKTKALIYRLKWRLYRWVFKIDDRINDDHERVCEMCEEDKQCKVCSHEDYSG